MRVFLMSIVAQILINPYIGWRGYQVLPHKPLLRKSFLALFFIEIALYFLGYFFYKNLPDAIFLPIFHLCGTWYIFILYIGIGFLLLEPFRLSRRIRQKIYPFIVIGVIGLLVNGYHVATHPVATYHKVYLEKKAKGRDSLRISFMADLHFGEEIGRKLAERYVALSNAQQPDIVMLGGDLIDYESRFAENEHIEEILQQLQSTLGTYIILGNHEYRANWMAKRKWIRQYGTLLIDSVASPDGSFNLIGRDDYINLKRKPLQEILENINTKKPLILLDHQPSTIDETLMNHIDLALYGHVHQGQLWPNSWLVKLWWRFSYGMHKLGNTFIYVTSGIGFAGPPYRIGTQGELAVIDVYFGRKAACIKTKCRFKDK